jgi:hypothetical protein
MPGPNVPNVPNSGNTYTCTCTRFCKGYKTGLSRATYYRHAPYRPPEYSAAFQAFLHNSTSSPGPSTGSNLTEHVDSESQAFLHNSTSTAPGPSTPSANLNAGGHAGHGHWHGNLTVDERIDERELQVEDSQDETFDNECEVSRILLLSLFI